MGHTSEKMDDWNSFDGNNAEKKGSDHVKKSAFRSKIALLIGISIIFIGSIIILWSFIVSKDSKELIRDFLLQGLQS